jgi:lipopolysaccharide biosynthesis regulator YciM
MAAQGKTFKWVLWRFDDVQPVANDEFVAVAEGFRIRLMGNVLELSFETTGTCSADSATTLAEKYVETLVKRLGSHLSLITEAEFLARTEPPFGKMTTYSRGHEGRSEVARAVREARKDVLSSADMALRRCYDHLQDAHERMFTLREAAAFDAYKAMEVLMERLGSESNAVAALVKKVKEAKRVANEGRHIPQKGQSQQKASGRSVDLAKEAVRAYERHLLGILR